MLFFGDIFKTGAESYENTGFILFGLAVCAAADVCAQSAQLELGVEDIAGERLKKKNWISDRKSRPVPKQTKLLRQSATRLICLEAKTNPKKKRQSALKK